MLKQYQPSKIAKVQGVDTFWMSRQSRLTTPWKINMEPTNHPFRKEHYLPSLHDYVPC